VKMALRKPRTARSMGLSDIELAEALGISLKRLVDALNEAGLCRCSEKATRQHAKDKIAASAAQGTGAGSHEGSPVPWLPDHYRIRTTTCRI
jgi:hypothetical protein